jgi:hypothetical protein
MHMERKGSRFAVREQSKVTMFNLPGSDQEAGKAKRF